MATPNGKAAGGREIEMTETQPGRIEPSKSFWDKVSSAARFAITGRAPDGWFGPSKPMPPAAPDESKGRQFDYPYAVNISYQPRGETGENQINFTTLRRMADPLLGGLDLMRLAIETRKDQMAGQQWTIKLRDDQGNGGEKARAIRAALRRPDGVTPFRVWQRALLEDLLVIDAPAIYINRTRGKPNLPSSIEDEPDVMGVPGAPGAKVPGQGGAPPPFGQPQGDEIEGGLDGQGDGQEQGAGEAGGPPGDASAEGDQGRPPGAPRGPAGQDGAKAEGQDEHWSFGGGGDAPASGSLAAPRDASGRDVQGGSANAGEPSGADPALPVKKPNPFARKLSIGEDIAKAAGRFPPGDRERSAAADGGGAGAKGAGVRAEGTQQDGAPPPEDGDGGPPPASPGDRPGSAADGDPAAREGADPDAPSGDKPFGLADEEGDAKPRLGPDGKPLPPEEPKLGPDGKPLPPADFKPRLDAQGKPLLDPEGNPLAKKPIKIATHTADEVGVLLEVVDGATLKRLLREDGRSPRPPDPAFVQNIKGMPAFHYTTDEVVYAPRNVRSNRIYGQSPVEQVVTTVDIALRRQMSQGEYYTAGSIPDMIMGVPETWTPAQVAEFQTYWDTILSGDTEARRRMRFVPGGIKPIPTKEPILKDMFDEWLARVICYAFSLSPQALVAQMNRATAETAEKQALSEGLEPLKLWWKDVMDTVLATAFDAPEMEFAYEDEEISDPKIKLEVWAGLVGAGIATKNEARDAYGWEPIEGLDNPPPPPMNPFGGPPGVPGQAGPPPGSPSDGPGGPPPPGGEKPNPFGGGKPGAPPFGKPTGAPPNGAKGGSPFGGKPAGGAPPFGAKKPNPFAAKMDDAADVVKGGQGTRGPRKRSADPLPPLTPEEQVVADTLGAFFVAYLDRLLSELDRVAEDATAKADAPVPEVRLTAKDVYRLSEVLPEEELNDLIDAMSGLMGAAVRKAAETALKALRASDYAGVGVSLDVVNQRAIDWASLHSGELITGITQTMKDGVKRMVEATIEDEGTVAQLREGLYAHPLFQGPRAEMIARTELAFANVNGNLIGWEDSGLVESVRWSTSSSEACDACLDMDNVTVPLGEMFVYGAGTKHEDEIEGPPAHPNCRCSIIPIVVDDPQAADEGGVGFDAEKVAKGDAPGHPFRGNQWTDGSGGGGDEDDAGTSRDTSAEVEERRGTMSLDYWRAKADAALAADSKDNNLGTVKDKWARMSVRDRDALADPEASVPARMADLLGDREWPSTGDGRADAVARVMQYADQMHEKSIETAATMVGGLHDELTQAGVHPEVAARITKAATDHLIAQEFEAQTRTLGDHGIHHLNGDAAMARDILKVLPGNQNTPENRVAVTLAAVYHDTGYLTPPSRMFLDGDHPRWSTQYAEEALIPDVKEAFGAHGAQQVRALIAGHDWAGIDFANEPVGTAFAVADNMALFAKEKTPPLLRSVPETIKTLTQFAQKKIDRAACVKTIQAQIEARSDLSSEVKARFTKAAGEITGMLPKMTLGMVGAKLDGFSWEDDHLAVHATRHRANEELGKVLDLNQKQFEKMAKTYGADPKALIEKGQTDFSSKDGRVLLRMRLANATNKGGWDVYGFAEDGVVVNISVDGAAIQKALRDNEGALVKAVRRSIDWVAKGWVGKGDAEGHPFRGNQHTDGQGGGDAPARWDKKGAPFRAAGFRQKSTGKIVGTGASHDILAVPDWTEDDWEDGFVGHDGRFFTRQQASEYVTGGPIGSGRGDFVSEALPWGREAIREEAANQRARMRKGDAPGHPFRGNQYTSGGGGGDFKVSDKEIDDAIDEATGADDDTAGGEMLPRAIREAMFGSRGTGDIGTRAGFKGGDPMPQGDDFKNYSPGEKATLRAMKQKDGVRSDADLTGDKMNEFTTRQILEGDVQPMMAPGLGAYLLKSGKAMETPDEAPKIKLGVPKECFMNAAHLVLSDPDRYEYAEGVEMSSHVPFPVHHAWAVEKATGKVVDPTLGWRPKSQYIGVRVKLKDLLAAQSATGYYGVLTDGRTGQVSAYAEGKPWKKARGRW